MSVQLCVFASSSKTQDTMWKLKNFPAFNFLREINFSQRKGKTLTWTL